MASLELGKLSSYDLLLAENSKDIFYVRLTDSLWKTLEEHHTNKNKGQIKLSVNKAGKEGSIQVETEKSRSRYKFSTTAISNKCGLDCLEQTAASPGLTLIGTASSRLIIQAREDVYQSTREKLILAEEKNNESQTVMIDFKNKRKSLPASSKLSKRDNDITPSSYSKPPPPQRPLPSFKPSGSTVASDSKAQRHLRERAIHILALRPHRKPELLNKLQGGSKSFDGITKILAMISSTQNNMFHLKNFLYNEVQVDTWPDYSDSDRASVRQQLQIMGIGAHDNSSSTDDKRTTDTRVPQTTISRVKGLSSSSESSVPEEPAKVATQKPKNNAMTSMLSKAPKFVKQTMPSKPADTQTDKPSNPQLDKTKNDSRKRSSSDDDKITKKQCRGDPHHGVDYNKKQRKAAEELKLPFISKVKAAISKMQQDYISITTEDQKTQYSTEFHKDYEEYVRLKKKEDEIGQQFMKLKVSYDQADKKSSDVRSINRKTRDLFKQYINDTNWCADKEKLMTLEAKLAHIKQLFKDYEGTVS